MSALAARVLTTGQAAVSIEALIEVQGVRSDPMDQGTGWTEALTTGQAAQSGLVSSLRAQSLRAWHSWPSPRKERRFFLVPLFSVTGLCQTASLFGGIAARGGTPKFSVFFSRMTPGTQPFFCTRFGPDRPFFDRATGETRWRPRTSGCLHVFSFQAVASKLSLVEHRFWKFAGCFFDLP